MDAESWVHRPGDTVFARDRANIASYEYSSAERNPGACRDPCRSEATAANCRLTETKHLADGEGKMTGRRRAQNLKVLG